MFLKLVNRIKKKTIKFIYKLCFLTCMTQEIVLLSTLLFNYLLQILQYFVDVNKSTFRSASTKKIIWMFILIVVNITFFTFFIIIYNKITNLDNVLIPYYLVVTGNVAIHTVLDIFEKFNKKINLFVMIINTTALIGVWFWLFLE